MGKLKNTQDDRDVEIRVQQDTIQISSTTPTNKFQVQEPATLQTEATAGLFFRKLFQQLFYSHIVLIAALIVFLTIRAFLLSASGSHHFYPLEWYPPLLASTATAGLVALLFPFLTALNPAKALRTAFWLSPLLTCGAGVLLIATGCAGGLVIGVVAVCFALIQSLYACWAGNRFDYAGKVLTVSLASPPRKSTLLLTLSLIASMVYSSFLVFGIGGATATGTGLDLVFILVLLLSLSWTLQVIKNTIHTTISSVKYMHHACGTDFDTILAFCNVKNNSMGSVCIGSAIAPVLVVIRGSARAMSLAAGDTDEFLFSCVGCYSGIASAMITYGNRWGFVQVGVYQKGFMQASMDTWEMFRRVGIESLIDSDLTGSFCFLCGMMGGAISTLAGGSWALAIHKGYATEVSIYAFLIGYFMSRVAMAWPQACVAAYYVAYAENPESLRFDSTIPVRIEQLQRYQARANES